MSNDKEFIAVIMGADDPVNRILKPEIDLIEAEKGLQYRKTLEIALIISLQADATYSVLQGLEKHVADAIKPMFVKSCEDNFSLIFLKAYQGMGISPQVADEIFLKCEGLIEVLQLRLKNMMERGELKDAMNEVKAQEEKSKSTVH